MKSGRITLVSFMMVLRPGKQNRSFQVNLRSPMASTGPVLVRSKLTSKSLGNLKRNRGRLREENQSRTTNNRWYEFGEQVNCRDSQSEDGPSAR